MEDFASTKRFLKIYDQFQNITVYFTYCKLFIINANGKHEHSLNFTAIMFFF